ncbi:MAG: amidohydrolase family protein, partial [Candidatus Heimdallarchaeaceae archaeon]
MKYAITNGKIYTLNKEEKVIEKGTILVSNGKIEAIIEGETTLPEGYEEINVDGKYVLPGFIDSHTHQGLFDGSVGWAG